MFTGIIQRIGIVRELITIDTGGRIVIETSGWERPYDHGESIAVNGVCLTLVEVDANSNLCFDVLQETFSKTNLGALRVGSQVNLERALRYGDAMGGHIVSGHVDSTGRVREIQAVGRDRRVRIDASAWIVDHLIHTGSIACDGISLTVAELFEDGFAVHLIPTTLEETSWGEMSVGDAINLEADMVNKMIRRSAERGKLPEDWTWEQFQQFGARQGRN